MYRRPIFRMFADWVILREEADRRLGVFHSLDYPPTPTDGRMNTLLMHFNSLGLDCDQFNQLLVLKEEDRDESAILVSPLLISSTYYCVSFTSPTPSDKTRESPNNFIGNLFILYH
jgi:hypothetical protein